MIVIVPLIACSWVSSTVGDPGTFLMLSVKLDFNRPVAPTTMGMISISSSHVVLRSFLKSLLREMFRGSIICSYAGLPLISSEGLDY